MTSFTIRTYGKSELALCYNPDITASAARRKLNLWIDFCPGLKERLVVAGGTNTRCYTPAQVRLIVDALGEP